VGCPFCEKLTRLSELPGDELVGQFRHSVALLGPWQYYAGYCVLVARTHAAELFDLPDDVRRGYLDEVTRLASAVARFFRPRKMNYELLGNQVPHLHWHLIPRYESDPDHLQPAWLAIDRAGRDPAEHRRLTGDADRSSIAARIRVAIAEAP
jgi:diadenosine tetraphosphate (Ap4A) HIT family hydrolase